MIEIINASVMNFENAIRGMRNPLNSWEKSDSNEGMDFYMGDDDLTLARRLRESGTDHRKFLRQILVCCDIEAPLFWWKQFDTYKVGTVANSCSTMHTIHKKKFEVEDFSISEGNLSYFVDVIVDLNRLREDFIKTGNKESWRTIIELLPSSYNQKRTVTMNYEVLLSMYNSRKNHKLIEWHTFCDWVEGLPYFKEICL